MLIECPECGYPIDEADENYDPEDEGSFGSQMLMIFGAAILVILLIIAMLLLVVFSPKT